MDILTYVLSKKYTDKVVTSLAGGMQYKGSKPTVADLPTPSESIKGHLYTVTENGHEYVCDGKEWVDLSKDLENKADKTELAAEILARSSADTDLQNNITTEANSRTSADNALQEGINQEAIAREQADITLQTNIDSKAALPSELPPELKVPGVDYPWFMINMEPKGIDADGNLRLDHSGYNFNTKQYYTWTDKVIPMAATETTGGLMTAADKVKLNKAITEHQDISGKLNVLPKVDDPTDPGYGWEYHIPYRFDFSTDAEKLNVKLHTLTLDNKLTKMKFDSSVPSATSTNAGLMSAADKVLVDTISSKADLPSELPPELKVPGVDYPWFMINMNPKSIDAQGQLHLDHSGYNFNTKQYYTWADKVIPMAATETTGGLMTAADKVKLNAALTEHQDISGKQDKLTAGTGIEIDENNKISADVRTYKPYPASWPHSTGTTIASFCAAVNKSYKDGEIKIGDAFLGNINSSAFFNGAYVENGGYLGSAEVSVQIMTPFGNNCVQLLTTTSSNNPPYHWEYTYVDGASTEGWRCWTSHPYLAEKLNTKQNILSAGTNIDITNNTVSLKVDSISLTGYDEDGTWHDGGTLSDSDANVLLASELNYIWMNGMHRLDFRYKDKTNNLATYSAQDGEKSHIIEITLYGSGAKTWRYKHIKEAPNDDGTYVFKCVVSDGVKTYSWVKE